MISPDLRTRLLRGEKLAAELPATRPAHRRYVVVLGVKGVPAKDPDFDGAPWRFRVSRYELREEFLDEHPGLENLLDYQTEVVDEGTLDAAVARLASAPVVLQPAAVVDAPY
jgi:hypothetical protein